MKRTTAFCIMAFLLMTPVIAEESKQKEDNTTYSVSRHDYQVGSTAYAHPQDLTEQQVARMLSAIRTATPSGRGKALFNAEERIQLAPEVSKLFATLGDKQQVEIVRKTIIPANSNTKSSQYAERVYMCFLNPETVYVAVRTEGNRFKSVLTIGNFMAPYQKQDGRIVPNIELLLKPLWTENIDKPIFDRNLENTMEALERAQSMENESVQGTTQESEPAGSMTIQELETELEKLRNLLDKKLISREEYDALRGELMKRAGVGGGR